MLILSYENYLLKKISEILYLYNSVSPYTELLQVFPGDVSLMVQSSGTKRCVPNSRVNASTGK